MKQQQKQFLNNVSDSDQSCDICLENLNENVLYKIKHNKELSRTKLRNYILQNRNMENKFFGK